MDSVPRKSEAIQTDKIRISNEKIKAGATRLFCAWRFYRHCSDVLLSGNNTHIKNHAVL